MKVRAGCESVGDAVAEHTRRASYVATTDLHHVRKHCHNLIQALRKRLRGEMPINTTHGCKSNIVKHLDGLERAKHRADT